MARKPKLTKDLIEEISKYISNGLSNIDACAVTGISQSAFYGWLQQGQEDKDLGKKTIKVELLENIKKAEALFKAHHLKNINVASNMDWKASAWMLERKYPKEYAKTDRTQVLLHDNSDEQKASKILVAIRELADEENDD